MAKVTAQVVGGALKQFDGVETISELREEMNLGSNYQATVNGEPAEDTHELKDYEFVSFAQKVKGA